MHNPFSVSQQCETLWENPSIQSTNEWLLALQDTDWSNAASQSKLTQCDILNVVLGRGFNRFTASIRNSAFHNLKNHPLPPRPLQALINVQKIDKISALRPLLGWWASHCTTSATSFYKERLEWLESLTSPEPEQLLTIHYTIASRQRLTTYRNFSPFAETYLAQPLGDYQAFITRYGDTFIDSYQFGGQLIAVLSGQSRTLNADLCGLTGRYTCIRSLVKQLVEMRRHFSELRAIYIIGGDPKTQNPTNMDLIKLLLDFSDQIYPETGHPTIFGVGLTPYEDLDCYPNHYPAICKFNYQHYFKLLTELDACRVGKNPPAKQLNILKKLQKIASAPDIEFHENLFSGYSSMLISTNGTNTHTSHSNR